MLCDQHLQLADRQADPNDRGGQCCFGGAAVSDILVGRFGETHWMTSNTLQFAAKLRLAKAMKAYLVLSVRAQEAPGAHMLPLIETAQVRLVEAIVLFRQHGGYVLDALVAASIPNGEIASIKRSAEFAVSQHLPQNTYIVVVQESDDAPHLLVSVGQANAELVASAIRETFIDAMSIDVLEQDQAAWIAPELSSLQQAEEFLEGHYFPSEKSSHCLKNGR